MGLKVGDKLPDFSLPMGTRQGRARFDLASVLGNGPIVIAFYPLAFTGVCTREVCDFRDALAPLAALNAQVFGFSIDASPSNAQFAKAHDLPFGLISDPNREVVHRIWETQTVVGVHDCAKRGVLVANAQGVVTWMWMTDNPEEWIGVQEVARHLPQ